MARARISPFSCWYEKDFVPYTAARARRDGAVAAESNRFDSGIKIKSKRTKQPVKICC
jgi:hypothetical protein